MKQSESVFMKKSIIFALFALVFSLFATVFAAAQNIDISGPAGSDEFGQKVVALPNGNIVVLDPLYDIPSGAANVGAAYLYNGVSGALISAITGSTAEDRVGAGDVVVLSNGNYVIHSPIWNNGAAIRAGAVTWCDAAAGCTGTVSAANSLVGSTADDGIVTLVTVLTNGNYVVRNTAWDNGAIVNAGAVTWCDGTTGCAAVISAANSFVGATANDAIGVDGVRALTNGNFVVSSSLWDSGATQDAGAVTFANGTMPLTGTPSAANSLIGSQTLDSVGSGGAIPLPNGNYFVVSTNWDNGAATQAGAVTFANGTTGITGAVSAANSLVGTSSGDIVGTSLTILTNGNYVISSQFWRNGSADNAGAATWCSATAGCTGPVSAANSLVGTTTDDSVSNSGITALANGNYVVRSPAWDNGAIANAGAVTFGNGTTGITGTVGFGNSLIGTHDTDLVGNITFAALTNSNYIVISTSWDNGNIVNAGAVTLCSGMGGCFGPVSPGNSLVGSTTNDRVGTGGVYPLANGNYVVVSSEWDNGGITDAGAVTFANGTTGVAGTISAGNSLVGSAANDRVGSHGVTALTNGNYVIASSIWNNGGLNDAGAVTFASGTSGISGTISAANSLVGTSANDVVGAAGITVLTNGNYVVNSSGWDNGGMANVGAVTFASGANGITGTISAANSLVGSTMNDSVGFTPAIALPTGNYVVLSKSWDDNGTVNAGAVTRGNGSIGTKGVIDMSNSVLGATPNGGSSMNVVFDAVNNQMVVGRPADNIVTLLRPLGPVAAQLTLSGTVTNGKNGVGGAIVSMTDSEGNTRNTRTNNFGYFKFENIEAGETLIVQVKAKGLIFNPQIITMTDDITDMEFGAEF